MEAAEEGVGEAGVEVAVEEALEAVLPQVLGEGGSCCLLSFSGPPGARGL